MNIFFLSLIPRICARYHCNKHVVKMILETTQLLWTCFQLLAENEDWKTDCPVKIYTPTFKNHPMCIWTRKSIHNYKWLLQLGIELCKEYTYRYSHREHTCENILKWLQQQFENNNMPNENSFQRVKSPYKKDQSFAVIDLPENCTKVPLCMPDDCKHNNLVFSYREYYMKKKVEFAKWGVRKVPSWFQPEQEEQEDK